MCFVYLTPFGANFGQTQCRLPHVNWNMKQSFGPASLLYDVPKSLFAYPWSILHWLDKSASAPVLRTLFLDICCCSSFNSSLHTPLLGLAAKSCVISWSRLILMMFQVQHHTHFWRVSTATLVTATHCDWSMSKGNFSKLWNADGWDFHKEIGQKCTLLYLRCNCTWRLISSPLRRQGSPYQCRLWRKESYELWYTTKVNFRSNNSMYLTQRPYITS